MVRYSRFTLVLKQQIEWYFPHKREPSLALPAELLIKQTAWKERQIWSKNPQICLVHLSACLLFERWCFRRGTVVLQMRWFTKDVTILGIMISLAESRCALTAGDSQHMSLGNLTIFCQLLCFWAVGWLSFVSWGHFGATPKCWKWCETSTWIIVRECALPFVVRSNVSRWSFGWRNNVFFSLSCLQQISVLLP